MLKIKTNGARYGPGDLLVLRPRNLKQQIEEFKEVLTSNGVEIRTDVALRVSQNSQIPVPKVLQDDITFERLCDEYFDLMAIPRRHTFEVLAQITDSELEREKCLEFTTAEGQDDLHTYVTRVKRNIVEVLRDFPHATKNLTEEMLFEIMPPIKPREFSIASNYETHRDEIHILLAIVRYKTKLVKERLGLCSNYLADLQEGDRVTAWLKRGSFTFPEDAVSDFILFFVLLTQCFKKVTVKITNKIGKNASYQFKYLKSFISTVSSSAFIRIKFLEMSYVTLKIIPKH